MIEIKHLDVVFGAQPQQALALLDQGLDREQRQNHNKSGRMHPGQSIGTGTDKPFQ